MSDIPYIYKLDRLNEFSALFTRNCEIKSQLSSLLTILTSSFDESLNFKDSNPKQVDPAFCDIQLAGFENIKSNSTMNNRFGENLPNDEFYKHKLEGKVLGDSSNMRFPVRVKKFQRERLSVLNDIKKVSLHLPPSANCLRGGASDDEQIDTQYLSLLTKIEQYKKKVQYDKSMQKNLSLFVERRAKQHFYDPEEDNFELTFNIYKDFLHRDSIAKVLLLSGETGVGKTLFGKHLQRVILFELNYEDQDPPERPWLPIFVSLSNLKTPKSSAITEALCQELLLTEDEIKVLQFSTPSTVLPRFLLIFDDYEKIQDVYNSINSDEECVQNNLFTLNKMGSDWELFKMIIICNEEVLSKVSHRALLFGPIDRSTKLPIKGSFLERVIEPLSDKEIESYLKKYIISKSSNFSVDDRRLSSSPAYYSWKLIEYANSLINRSQLKELLRIPVLLSIGSVAIFDLVIECQQATDSFRDKPESLVESGHWETLEMNLHSMYDRFIEKATRSAVTSFQIQHTKESNQFSYTKKRLEDIALRTFNYKLDEEIDTPEIESILSLCPLVKKDLESCRFVLVGGFLGEYIVSKKIEEEIIARFSNDTVKTPENFLLNQKLLSNNKVSSRTIIFFLQEAIKSNRITADHLIRIVQASKKQERGNQYQDKLRSNPSKSHDEEEQKRAGENQNSAAEIKIDFEKNFTPLTFEIAASNAMTILNASGFDFSHRDFSNTRISYANLSYGLFEETNFKNADLTGVNFKGAWLLNTNFERATLSDIQLGIIPSLKFNETVKRVTFSPDGRNIVACVGSDVLRFERGSYQKPYKGVSTIIKYVWNVNDCSFSPDGKQLVVGRDESVCIRDSSTGDAIKIVGSHASRGLNCRFSPNGNEIISFGNDRVLKKWTLSTGNSKEIPQKKAGKLEHCEFSPDSKQIILADSVHGIVLHNAASRRYLRVYPKMLGRGVSYVKFSGNGKQIVGLSNVFKMCVFDSVRPHLTKFISHYNERGAASLIQCSFTSDDKQLILLERWGLTIKNLAACNLQTNEQSYQKEQSETHKYYSIHPYKKLGVLVQDDNTISFQEISPLPPKGSPMDIRGSNKKGLNIRGANIYASSGLSFESISTFKQNGDYNEFPIALLKSIVLRDSSDPDDIKEVKLNNRKFGEASADLMSLKFRWGSLKKLDLSNNKIDYFTSTRELASNTTWKKLEELRLDKNFLQNKFASSLAVNTSWKNIRKLNLGSNRISDLGAIALGENMFWTDLEELYLEKNSIGNEGASGISKNFSWVNLKKLDVGHNLIGDEGATAIGKNKSWARLKELRLHGNMIKNNESMIALVSNLSWSQLCTIELSKNPLKTNEEDILMSLDAIVSQNLETLSLPMITLKKELLKYAKFMAPEGVHEVMLSKGNCSSNIFPVFTLIQNRWTNLRKLDLSDNKIDEKIVENFEKNAICEELQELNLSNNQIGKTGGLIVGRNISWKSLRTLNLQGNKIKFEAASAICKNKAWNHLEALDLSRNMITDKAIIILSQNTTWTELRRLNLEDNSISHLGAAALSKNTAWINLQDLNLANNSI